MLVTFPYFCLSQISVVYCRRNTEKKKTCRGLEWKFRNFLNYLPLESVGFLKRACALINFCTCDIIETFFVPVCVLRLGTRLRPKLRPCSLFVHDINLSIICVNMCARSFVLDVFRNTFVSNFRLKILN